MVVVSAREPTGAARGSPDAIYREVCESMTSGVLLIDGQGRIETCNPAAAAILGLEADTVVGRTFAETFVAEADYDELNEAILAAIYEGVVGEQRMVTVSVDGATVPLAVATSYLRDASAGDAGRRAVVAVFSDVSELEQLRVREAELATSLEARHQELRSAYRDLEARNGELDTLLRKVHVVRVAASAGVVALTLAIGTYVASGSSTDLASEPAPDGGAPGHEPRLVTVEPQRLVSTITVPGEIRPRGEVSVNSPMSGQVGAVHVKRGQSVRQGAPLLDLDVTQVQIQGRRAQAAYLTAKARVDDFADWPASVEVSRTRRAVAKARIALEAANTKVEETSFLVERGLVPSASGDAAERERQTRRLDLETAEQDLEAILARGHESREVARLELQNARAELEQIEWALENATIVAPVAGVVVSLREESSPGGQTLSPGASIQAGEHLLTIGDMRGVTVTGRVDEVDVGRVRAGHAVRVSGPAFADIMLEGSVAHVSSQALPSHTQQGLPSFEIAAVVETLDKRARGAVRLGMSAEMQIDVYTNEQALLVPFAAVTLTDGEPRVRVWDEASRAERSIGVTAGITTSDAVEILAGLRPGDRVVTP